MKYRFFSFLCSTAVALASCSHMRAWAAPDGPSEAPGKRNSSDNPLELKTLLEQYNSVGSAVADLAVERFTLNESRGEHWILATQDAVPEVLKVTDGKFTLIGLPDSGTDSYSGWRTYVTVYNTLVIRAADAQARSGRWKEAETVYRLVLEHDRHLTGRAEVEARVKLAEQARTGSDGASLVRKLDELEPTWQPWAAIQEMGLLAPRKVKDLMAVDWNDLELDAPTKPR